MTAFGDLLALEPLRIRDGVAARVVEGERATFAVIELDPESVVPEHAHDNEQLGVCLQGSMRMRIGDEVREVGPGSTWSIPSNVPHDVEVGPDGSWSQRSSCRGATTGRATSERSRGPRAGRPDRARVAGIHHVDLVV